MKHIHSFLEQHPKLKKIAKILGVIAIVFSFLFNALIIGSLIVTSVKDNNNNIEPKALLVSTPVKPQPKNTAIYENGNDYAAYLSTSDLSFNRVFTRGKRLYGEQWSYLQPVDLTYTYTINNDLSLFISNNSGDLGTYQYFTLVNWTISKDYFDSHITFYKIDFYNGVDHYYVEYVVYSNLYATGNVGSVKGDIVVQQSVSGTNAVWANSVGVRYIRDTSVPNALDRPFDFLFVMSNGTDDGYAQGYADGYSIGSNNSYQIGYDNGHYIGYQEGYNVGQSTLTSDPFDMLARAFGSIASILNIQVLPGLNLGVLIFTPLVVTIIIVIVKMFKG